MLPHGLCIDLETTITGRVPDTVRPRGKKRYETRVIEIGAIDWNTGRHWGCIVNPIMNAGTLKSSNEFFQHLRDIHQKPDATVDFWSKVLVKRGALTPRMIGGEPPQVWLGRTTKSRATDFVRWFGAPHTGPTFVCEKTALKGLVNFTHESKGSAWMAHNGKSFDFKVLTGVAERHRVQIPRGIHQVDTLHVFRKALPGHKSYSQPVLYYNLFGHKYNAHVAIDDAKALARICKHVGLKTQQCAEKSKVPEKSKVTEKKSEKKPMNLTFQKRIRKKGMARTFAPEVQKNTQPSLAKRVQYMAAMRARVLLRKVTKYVK